MNLRQKRGLILIHLLILVIILNSSTICLSIQESFNKKDMPSGNLGLVWNTTWGGSSDDRARGVALDSTGAVYCAGATVSFGSPEGKSDGALVKFYQNGSKEWNITAPKPMGGNDAEELYGIAINDSMLYCTGFEIEPGEGSWFTEHSYSTNGIHLAGLWTIPHSYQDVARDVAVYQNKVYWIGRLHFFSENYSNWRLNVMYRNYTMFWGEWWGGLNNDRGTGVAIDNSGAIYLAGSTRSYGAGKNDFALVKFFPNQTKSWEETWGGDGEDECFGVAIDPSGAIYCIGYTQSFGNDKSDLALVKFFSNGTLAWNITWGGSGSDKGYGIAINSTGEIYCTGITNSSGSNFDVMVITVYSNGTIAENIIWGGPQDDYCYDIAIDSAGNIYCAGETYSFGAGGSDLLLLKFKENLDLPSDKSNIPGFEALLIIFTLITIMIIDNYNFHYHNTKIINQWVKVQTK